jgi:hypothetical protein
VYNKGWSLFIHIKKCITKVGKSNNIGWIWALAWVYLLVGPHFIAKVLSGMFYYVVRACLFVCLDLVGYT